MQTSLLDVAELAVRIPPGGYSQFIPPRDASGCHFARHGPPALPPHLLQSVLNADLPEHVSHHFWLCKKFHRLGFETYNFKTQTKIKA